MPEGEPLPEFIDPRLQGMLGEQVGEDRSRQVTRLVRTAVEAGWSDGQIVTALARHAPYREKYGTRSDPLREAGKLISSHRAKLSRTTELAEASGLVTQPTAPSLPTTWVESVERGGIILDSPPMPTPLWGSSEHCAWAKGEPTLLYAPTGIGKTTIARQLALRLIGVGSPTLLGMPVAQVKGKVLYLAYDRPAQAVRSMRRMIVPADRDLLEDRLLVERRRLWRIDPMTDPAAFTHAAVALGVSVVVIDSLKDIVGKLTDPEMATAYNSAIQHMVALGVEVLTLHHPRKTSDGKDRALTLDDVYGSVWIVAGQGSVIALNGEAGTTVADWHHLKMPSGEVESFAVRFDYAAGTVSTEAKVGILDLLVESSGFAWVTNADLAERAMEGGNTASNRKKVDRRMQKFTGAGEVEKAPYEKGKHSRYRMTQQGRDTHQPRDIPRDTVGGTQPETPKDVSEATDQEPSNSKGSSQRHTQRHPETPSRDILAPSTKGADVFAEIEELKSVVESDNEPTPADDIIAEAMRAIPGDDEARVQLRLRYAERQRAAFAHDPERDGEKF